MHAVRVFTWRNLGQIILKVRKVQNVEKSLKIKQFKFTLKRVNRLSQPNIIRYIVPQNCYPIKIVVPKS